MKSSNILFSGSIVLGTIAALFLGQGSSPRAQDSAAAKDGSAPVESDMHEFMEYVFQPTYLRLQKLMASEPADNQGWKGIKADALTLAEGGNLLLIRVPKEDGKQWVQHSVQARDLGGQLYQAAKKKDFKSARKHYETMLTKCNACHQQLAVCGRGASVEAVDERGRGPEKAPLYDALLRYQRVFGPGVLGVSAPQFLANGRIGAFPKTSQVVGDLLGPHIRREEVEQYRDPTGRHARRRSLAEHLLNADCHHGRAANFILQPDAGALGRSNRFGSFPIERGQLVARQQSAEDPEQRRLAELGKRFLPTGQMRQQSTQFLVTYVRQMQFGHPLA
jgi:hypothetical protein